MKAAFFDLDRALLRSPLESAVRRFIRRSTRRPPMTAKAEFELRLRRQARALIAAHHWRGHVVVLVTDGTPEWAELAAGELDADGVLTRGDALKLPQSGPSPKRSERSATPAFDPVGQESPANQSNRLDGLGSGTLRAFRVRRPAPQPNQTGAIEWRSGAITKFCLRYNFAPGACFGYGALADDWLWLETLGHPMVAHPAGKLRRRAQRAGWPIVNLNRRSDLRTPPALSFGSAPPSAPPCVSLT